MSSAKEAREARLAARNAARDIPAPQTTTKAPEPDKTKDNEASSTLPTDDESEPEAKGVGQGRGRGRGRGHGRGAKSGKGKGKSAAADVPVAPPPRKRPASPAKSDEDTIPPPQALLAVPSRSQSKIRKQSASDDAASVRSQSVSTNRSVSSGRSSKSRSAVSVTFAEPEHFSLDDDALSSDSEDEENSNSNTPSTTNKGKGKAMAKAAKEEIPVHIMKDIYVVVKLFNISGSTSSAQRIRPDEPSEWPTLKKAEDSSGYEVSLVDVIKKLKDLFTGAISDKTRFEIVHPDDSRDNLGFQTSKLVSNYWVHIPLGGTAPHVQIHVWAPDAPTTTIPNVPTVPVPASSSTPLPTASAAPHPAIGIAGTSTAATLGQPHAFQFSTGEATAEQVGKAWQSLGGDSIMQFRRTQSAGARHIPPMNAVNGIDILKQFLNSIHGVIPDGFDGYGRSIELVQLYMQASGAKDKAAAVRHVTVNRIYHAFKDADKTFLPRFDDVFADRGVHDLRWAFDDPNTTVKPAAFTELYKWCIHIETHNSREPSGYKGS
ncbi:hypothetical protein DL93DRAFT_2091658 [Clavulina sp. PMI_390]|nr:hypothetical protein DL93DRAFT_2091658 [Clavulina sp. PMI_390]